MAISTDNVRSGGRRRTEPLTVNPMYGSQPGYTLLPRPVERVHASGLATLEGAGLCSLASPLALLEVLAQTYPPLAKADNDEAGLLLPPEGLHIYAVDPEGGEDAVDEEGTRALDRLWSSIPPPLGGVNGVARALLREVNYTGIPAVEAVPGPSGAGVAEVHVVSGRTLYFGRASSSQPIVPFQRLSTGQYLQLDIPTFFWTSWCGTEDRPYGFPRRWPAFNDVLSNIQLRSLQRDAVRHIAWPRLLVQIAYSGFWQTATEQLHLSGEEANAWVAEKVTEFMDKVETLRSDDTLFVPSDSGATVIEGGAGLDNAEGILTRFERSEVQGLMSLPAMFGINDSTTETTINTQLDLLARTLEGVRTGYILPLLLKVSNLHLRLLGLPLVAKCDPPSIFHDDEKLAAETEALRTETLAEWARMGVITGDDLAEALAGSSLADPERFRKWLDGRSGEGDDPAARLSERRRARTANGAASREG